MLSHFPGTDRYGSPEFDYDRGLLEALRAGRGRELAAVTAEELDKTGNIELRTWITLLGAVGGAKADVYCYEPSWHHVEWPLAVRAAGRRGAAGRAAARPGAGAPACEASEVRQSPPSEASL